MSAAILYEDCKKLLKVKEVNRLEPALMQHLSDLLEDQFAKGQEKNIKRLALEEKKRCRRLQLENGYEETQALSKPEKIRLQGTSTKKDWMKERGPGTIPQPSLLRRKKHQDTFQNFWVLTLWKLSSVLVVFTDSESCAGLHAKGNIAGSADHYRLIPQSTAYSHSPTYLLVQNSESITLKGEVLHGAFVSTFPCPEL
ncbi:unnamed protein product [Schistocephalus solidus]|uniref:Pyrin domain-containing protein n=1 Tax=Schistocephalus solidus TaxID=70667 RepID=A0A183T5P5_SCHSO|nr:unnamed protein product [Schistocephalus solidus]